jgi:hypothetical protein
MAEEKEKKEVPELDAIKAENSALKAKIEALTAKLKAYEDDKEKEKEAKVKAAVQAALDAGKIKAEVAPHLVEFGLMNYAAMSATLDNIQVVITPEFTKTIDPAKTVAYATKDEAFKAFKEGKIKTLNELEELTKTMEG